MLTQTKTSWWRRLLRRGATERATWLENGEWQHHDLLASQLTTPEARRAYRSDADMAAIYGAVFAAIRRRVRAVSVPRLMLLRTVGKEQVEVDSHPALDALHRVNESLTYAQGMGLIEQHKLTAGKAYWIKRRNRLGTVVEFEIWQPEAVEVIPDRRKPWVPAAFRLHRSIGYDETVARDDVVWFRHLVDPRNPLNGLSPISAVRLGLDTGLEAQRFNQRFFDNSTVIGQVFSAADAGPAEIARLEKEIERKFRSTDRSHGAMVIGGEVKALETPVSHRDMEFREQLQWQVEEVARAFEMAPEIIGVGGRTFENVEHAMRDFWQMIVDQVQTTIDEFNEFFITPDFGPEFALAVSTDNIPALQEDRQKRAAVDEIYLRTGVLYINEVRERDGLDSVAWGDVPLLPNNIAPLGSAPPPSPTPPGPPRTRSNQWPEAVNDAEAYMADGWEKRLERELRGIIAHLNKMAKRALDISDVGSYDWDWWDQYGDSVMHEVSVAYSASLSATGFVETPLLGIQTIAARFARERSSELLSESGRLSIPANIRDEVRKLVAETIENGDSLQTLSKRLRESYVFDRRHAETIARTETAHALGKASMVSFQSQGWEGKRWLTAGDGKVCAFCRTAEGDGVIPLARHFSNGAMDTGDSHPRCRCKLEPSLELPRSRNGHHAGIGV